MCHSGPYTNEGQSVLLVNTVPSVMTDICLLMGEEASCESCVKNVCVGGALCTCGALSRISDGLSFTIVFSSGAMTGGPQVGNLEAK